MNWTQHELNLIDRHQDGMATSPEVVEDIVMAYFKDPGFSPNPYKELPIDGLKALVKRAKIVMAGNK